MEKILRVKGLTLAAPQREKIKEIFRKADDFHIGADAILHLHVTQHGHSADGESFTVQARLRADGHQMIFAEANADTPMKAAHKAEDHLTFQLRKYVKKRSDHRH